MTLYKKLAGSVLLLLIGIFIGTLLINGAASVRYLSEQLSFENRDDAIATARDFTERGLDLQSMQMQLGIKLDHSAVIRRVALLDSDSILVDQKLSSHDNQVQRGNEVSVVVKSSEKVHTDED